MSELRQVLMTKVSKELDIEYNIVEMVIMDAYAKSRKALLDNNVTSLEISGLGVFKTSLKKIDTQLVKAHKQISKNIANDIYENIINDLNEKRKAHNRGLEESSSTK